MEERNPHTGDHGFARVRQARNEAQAAMEQAEAEAVQAKANRDNAAAQQDAPSLDQTFNGYTL